MDNRRIACMFAAGFLGLAITAAAASAHAAPRNGNDVTITGIDPSLQRTVSYSDLNLARKHGQRALRYRISYTARDLCNDINGWDDGSCSRFAIDSTRDQVKDAIARAQLQMAGVAVGPPIAISMVIGIR